MSYCRFSSMNMMCDVYVYADCNGGWTTHVAARRMVIPPIPEPPFSIVIVRGAEFSKGNGLVYKRKIDKTIAAITSRLYMILSYPHKLSMAIIPSKPIGLPHDGALFNDETAADCAATLEHLRTVGYNVPQYAIDALREEAMDTNEPEETHL